MPPGGPNPGLGVTALLVFCVPLAKLAGAHSCQTAVPSLIWVHQFGNSVYPRGKHMHLAIWYQLEGLKNFLKPPPKARLQPWAVC
jgi:hypothetical protein